MHRRLFSVVAAVVAVAVHLRRISVAAAAVVSEAGRLRSDCVSAAVVVAEEHIRRKSCGCGRARWIVIEPGWCFCTRLTLVCS